MNRIRSLVFVLACFALVGCAKEVPAPKADAGLDTSVNVGTVVRLDGSASIDPDGRLLRFEWRFLTMPDGSTARLNDATLASPSFTPDVTGDFVLGLRVDNGIKRSAEDTVTASVGSGAPTAVISPAPVSVNAGTAVQLSGGSSTDPDGHLLRFHWWFSTLPTGSTAVLIGADTASPSFVPDLDGTYVVSLVASDEFGNESAPASVTVVVGSGAPTATIATPPSVRTGTSVQLSGAASSDPDNHLLYYQWSFAAIPQGSAVILIGADTATPSFVPDLAGDYVARLVVHDGSFGNVGAPASATVSVGSGAPTATIATPPSVRTGTSVQLSGTASSDPDAHLLFFRWAFTALPAASQAQLIGADTAAPSFTPDLLGTYVVRLVVDDGPFGNESAPASVTVSVGDGKPTAAITPSGVISVAAGTVVQLSGSTSSDPDSHLIRYQWSFAAVPPGSESLLNEPAAVNPSFMPDMPGDYVVRLVVDDGSFGNVSAPVEKVVTVTGDCTPTANAGADQTGDQLESIQFNGSASDSPCGRLLTYAWAFTSMPAASAAVINDGSLAAPAFVADLAGTYTLSLVVTDTEGLSSAADTVLATVGSCVPTANPTTPITGKLQGDTVQLLGGIPTEPCAMPVVQWKWSFSSTPTGSLASLSSETARNPTFVADLAGSYVLKLEVTNSGGLTSALTTVDVPSVGSCVPTAVLSADSARTVDGETVRLSDVSTSPCARALAPAWKIVSTPSGSVATLTDAGSKTPAFDADLPGDYVVRLVVTDTTGIVSPPATATVAAARRRVDVADTGSYGSLRLRGASETPAQSYYDATDGDLKYAEFDGANWQIELVDLAGDVGEYNSLALTPDVAALPRVAYWDAGNDNLKYAERDAAGNWGTVTVDAGDLEDGRYASLALDPTTGKPRIVYQARQPGAVVPKRVLKYAFCNAADCLTAANWTKIVLVDAADGEDLGAAAQLALVAGVPRFSYYHQDNGTLHFGACTTSACTTVTTRQVDGPDVGEETSLVLNGVGNPRLAYHDGGNANAKFATCGDNATLIDCTAAGAVWTLRTLETTGDTGRQPSIVLAPDATEDPRIVWQDRTRKVGRYATFSTATGLWTIGDRISAVGNSDRGISLRLTTAGNPRVSYYGDGVNQASFYRREP